MSVLTHVGNFAMPTGAAGTTLAITGVGFQPTFVLFIMDGLTASSDGSSTAAPNHFAMGIAISTTDRRFYATFSGDAVSPTQGATGHRADGCIGVVLNTTTWDGWMDLSSMDSDGFTIKVGQQLSSANAYKVHYLAVGGTEITVKSGTFTKNTTAGNQGVTGAGLKPDALILIGGHPSLTNALPDLQLNNIIGVGAGTFQGNGQQAVMTGADANGLTTSQCRHTQSLGNITAEWASGLTTIQNSGTLVSMDSDGFTINFSSTGGALVYDYIAFKGGLYNLAEVVTAVNTTIINTNAGFKSCGGFHFSSQQPEDNFTIRTNNLLGFGMYDYALNQNSVTMGIVDAKNPSQVVLGSSFSNFTVYVNPTGGFAQRTQILTLDTDVGFFTYQNGNADGDANLMYVLQFGAEVSNKGGYGLV